MSDLSELKLTDGDVARSGVVAAPDKLTGTAAQNKALFDRLVREAVKEKFNAMVDALEASLAWEPYDAEKDYVPDNKVVYNGSSYLCLDVCKGVLPTNTDYWRLIAAKGRDGTGAGDMTRDVYDPRGVEGDIFTYVDERTDTYTRAQTLSAETKTALGLTSAAVPDDAFQTLLSKSTIIETTIFEGTYALQTASGAWSYGEISLVPSYIKTPKLILIYNQLTSSSSMEILAMYSSEMGAFTISKSVSANQYQSYSTQLKFVSFNDIKLEFGYYYTYGGGVVDVPYKANVVTIY